MPLPRLVLCARPGIDKGKPGVTRGRKATGLDVPTLQSAGLPEVLLMAYWDGERWLDERTGEPRKPSKARRAFTHSWQLLLEGLLVALLVVGLIAGTAFAGKGSGSATTGGGHNKGGSSAGTGTLSGPVLLDSTDGIAHYGQSITFRVTSTSKYYFVRATCKQNGAQVWQQTQGFYPGWLWGTTYVLNGLRWTSGAADCSAVLYSQNLDGSNQQTQDSLTFHVAD
jgi:hypothetical protein